jgi:biotin synthase
MLTADQAQALACSGLDYYNHNLDTSLEYYPKIITTRCYEDRLKTLAHIAQQGLKTCCGGIMGMGETRADRISFLQQLASLSPQPHTVPINRLIAIIGTPLENAAAIDDFEFVRVIAIARIIMPKAMLRLSAGRDKMSDMMQSWCFFAGVNSIFYGEKLLITDNASANHDDLLLAKLSIQTQPESEICIR